MYLDDLQSKMPPDTVIFPDKFKKDTYLIVKTDNQRNKRYISCKCQLVVNFQVIISSNRIVLERDYYKNNTKLFNCQKGIVIRHCNLSEVDTKHKTLKYLPLS